MSYAKYKNARKRILEEVPDGLGYKKEINLPCIKEEIAERFDQSIFNLMTPKSLVYGGIIRDVLAKLPLSGDLDIVSSGDDYLILYDNLLDSPKLAEIKTELFEPGFESKDEGYNPEQLPMSDIISFESFDGSIIQLMMSKGDSENLVYNVDIICCGVCMDRKGKVFELIEGAHEDCKNKVLRLNKNVLNTIDVKRLNNRVDKLVGRGWVSEIDFEEIKHIKSKEKTIQTVSVLKDNKRAFYKEYFSGGNMTSVDAENHAKPLLHSDLAEAENNISVVRKHVKGGRVRPVITRASTTTKNKLRGLPKWAINNPVEPAEPIFAQSVEGTTEEENYPPEFGKESKVWVEKKIEEPIKEVKRTIGDEEEPPDPVGREEVLTSPGSVWPRTHEQFFDVGEDYAGEIAEKIHAKPEVNPNGENKRLKSGENKKRGYFRWKEGRGLKFGENRKSGYFGYTDFDTIERDSKAHCDNTIKQHGVDNDGTIRQHKKSEQQNGRIWNREFEDFVNANVDFKISMDAVIDNEEEENE